MSVEYRVGDVFDQLAAIPTASIDLIVTSPPFLALRSYLPDDHPDKAKEIGSETTPAEFLDTMLALSAELGRVLAPHGSLCVELGDTYSGSGGAGGDYNADGLRAGQPKFKTLRRKDHGAPGWPMGKSLTGIPTLYTWSLAYGRNLLTGIESPAGMWRIRNVIVWARPNPPVGALGDKFRPATSYITVACKGGRRYFDLDAVRGDAPPVELRTVGDASAHRPGGTDERDGPDKQRPTANPAGAPPLDWHSDMPDTDGDWLWKLSTQPYAGSHYATFPLLIEAMCPQRVCTVCGRPSERIAETTNALGKAVNHKQHRPDMLKRTDLVDRSEAPKATERRTLGWSDCGHDAWRTGVVLDPFAGSGTTLEAAQIVGRHAIGFDLDQRNADLARERVGMFLEVAGG